MEGGGCRGKGLRLVQPAQLSGMHEALHEKVPGSILTRRLKFKIAK